MGTIAVDTMLGIDVAQSGSVLTGALIPLWAERRHFIIRSTNSRFYLRYSLIVGRILSIFKVSKFRADKLVSTRWRPALRFRQTVWPDREL